MPDVTHSSKASPLGQTGSWTSQDEHMFRDRKGKKMEGMGQDGRVDRQRRGKEEM